MGESVNCDESWMSGSKSGSADLNIGVVTRGGGGDRLDPGADFLAAYRGRSGKDRWPFLSGGELVPSLGAWSSQDSQSKPRPMQVTPQLLPTLAVLSMMGGAGASQSSSSKVRSRADCVSIKRTKQENVV